MLPSNGWCPVPGEVGQGSQKVFTFWRHWQKTCTPKQKVFFRVRTTRLATSFHTLTTSVTHAGAEIFPLKATCDLAVFCKPLELLTWMSKCWIITHNILLLWIRGDEPICYRAPLCRLPLSNRAAQRFSHPMKPVSSRLLVSPECESSKLLVSPECFAGKQGGPHIHHPCFRSSLLNL